MENIKIMLGFEIKEHFLSWTLMDKALTRSNELDTHEQLKQYFFSFSRFPCTTKHLHTGLKEPLYVKKLSAVNSDT